MLHACVKRFNVTGTVEIFFGTKQGLSITPQCKYAIGNTIPIPTLLGDLISPSSNAKSKNNYTYSYRAPSIFHNESSDGLKPTCRSSLK